ncbi:hypothetical protein JCM11641_007236 [Rhodosporidiobolus odoratus]
MPVLEFPPPPSASESIQLSPSHSPTSLPQQQFSSTPTAAYKIDRHTVGSQVAQAQRMETRSPRHASKGETQDTTGQGAGEGEGEGEGDDVSMDLALTQSQPQAASQELDGLLGAQERGQREEGGDEEGDEALLSEIEGAGRNGRGSRRSSSSESAEGVPLHIEVRLLPTSTMRYDLIRRLMHQHLDSEYETLLTHAEVHDWRDVGVLAQNVDRVWVGDCSLPTPAVPLDSVSLHLHIYQPPSTSRLTEFAASAQTDEDDSDTPAASVLELPSLSLEGVWDTLIYDGDVKGKLLNYIYSTLLFSDAMVDFNVVTWNRVVLLHGPPGTGKTSLCRALAQKLAIRLSERYQTGKLIEINSHSLFSKWFSESGKLVQRLFAQVTEMVDDEGCFVVVLIDEVESLTAARAGAMSGKEPSDALRVVNALLTQLDKLKTRKNVLIMTTSNLSGAIDNAFIDRADIKQYIGLPPAAAVFWILQSCLSEIMRVGLVPPVTLHSFSSVEAYRDSGRVAADGDEQAWACSEKLYDLSHACQGLSGRTLRRLPVLAHARHISSSASFSFTSGRRPGLEKWIDAMRKCVEEEGKEMEKVQASGDV